MLKMKMNNYFSSAKKGIAPHIINREVFCSYSFLLFGTSPDMRENSCIIQTRAEPENPALPICSYSQILYRFLEFTQNLKQSLGFSQIPL